MAFTSDDVVTIFNSVGFTDANNAIASLGLAKFMVDSGVSDIFITRMKLLNQENVLAAQIQQLMNDKQSAMNQAGSTYDDQLNTANANLASIRQQLAQNQVF